MKEYQSGRLSLVVIERDSELVPDRLLETVMDLAVRKLDADRGLLILFDGPGGEMRARVARNMEQETIDDALAYSRHVVQEAAEGRPVLSFDARRVSSSSRARFSSGPP